MKEKAIEFIKFSMIGGVMTLLNFVLYYLLIEIVGMHYMLSNVISYTIAVVISYFLNVRVTFRVEVRSRQEHLYKLLAFFAMKLAFLAADSLLLYLLVQMAGVGPYTSKIIITIVMTLFSFFSTRIIITK